MTEYDEIDSHTATDPDKPNFPAAGLEELLTYLHESRGFDFDIYKRSGLARRIGHRASSVGATNYNDYLDYLQVHPDEFGNLFNSLLINATGFFRDPSAWDYLATAVVPRLLELKKPHQTFRVWCAGCATGQEAYTIAMLLAEAIGETELVKRVKIYATDIDTVALNQARHGAYTPKEVAAVPAELLAKYFYKNAGRLTFLKHLRRAVIFGRHDIFSDAPISRIDLLLCRNTLMYFNADAQARVLSNLHFSLNEAGVLFLGRAEMLLTHSSLFTPLDLKRRLFNKVTHNFGRKGTAGVNLALGRSQETNAHRAEEVKLREAAFETSPVAQLAIDNSGVLVIANEPARRVLGLAPTDLGHQLRDLAQVRRIGPLLAGIDQAENERRVVHAQGIEWRGLDAQSLYFDLTVTPVLASEGGLVGSEISLLEVTDLHRVQKELQRTAQEREGAYEELQSTSEELETTNEELQSTVEELETTNEELQSTNEELETTNEELQSTNEELQGMNDELRMRSSELGRVNLYFESILSSIRSAVIVLDLELRVQVWSARAVELWGLRSDEVIGQHLLNLDIGLPVQRMVTELRACLTGEHEFAEIGVEATNRRGKKILCRVMLSRLTQEDAPEGVILLMDDRELTPAELEARGPDA